ncbi:phosphate ABC transporter substrate-binding protein PstS [Dongshaea marina]|uniref:phosphate ABC transporter substrate-binding protein PstS n=1 Tax=Dongshaea marina TaxID=2047966 RepID=UPI000D3EA28B|nr:phosphate ABC transporter substrate-binding protein PstS [Dongshaea marina]
MKLNRLLKVGCVSALMLSATSAWSAETVNGAGSTFIYPVLAKWASSYHKDTGVAVNYQSIGSGGGIKLIKSQTVDFGASDAPLSAKELKDAGLVQWPMVMGGIVPVVNIPGVKSGALKLDGKLLADIYMGKVKSWNDPRIAELNPGLKLPQMAIYAVHRAEGSGTTYNFTAYLNQVSNSWKSEVGMGKMVSWPKAANQLGGKGNAGVANFVKRIPGSIGYVEYAYADENHLAVTQMRNKAGKYVQPNLETFQAAAANGDWAHAPGMKLILVNQPGAHSWPITATTFILMQKDAKNPAASREALKFFDWSYSHGVEMAKKLDYVPMPQNVVKLVQSVWSDKLHATPQTLAAK